MQRWSPVLLPSFDLHVLVCSIGCQKGDRKRRRRSSSRRKGSNLFVIVRYCRIFLKWKEKKADAARRGCRSAGNHARIAAGRAAERNGRLLLQNEARILPLAFFECSGARRVSTSEKEKRKGKCSHLLVARNHVIEWKKLLRCARNSAVAGQTKLITRPLVDQRTGGAKNGVRAAKSGVIKERNKREV